MIDTRGYVEWFRYLSNTYDVSIERVAGWNHRVVFMDGQSINFHRFDVDREQLERTIAHWSRHCNVEYFKRQWRIAAEAVKKDINLINIRKKKTIEVIL